MLTINDNNFKQELESAKKIVILDIWAPWCGPCKMVTPALEKICKADENKFDLFMANMKDFTTSAKQLNIKATPTLIIFKNGIEIARRSGAMMSSQIKQWINENIN